MESLIEAISRVDFHENEAQELKSKTQGILTNIDTLLDSNEKTVLPPVLPLVVFVYAIKNIIYPKFLIELIPDFLDLLTMVEFYRIQATEEASTALTWNNFYKTEKGPRTLEVQDEEFLSHLQDTQEGMRKIFMQIVAECCLIDLHRLWVTESHTDFWIRWNRYFNTKEKENTKQFASFHHGLSNADKDLLRTSATCCAETMHSTLIRAEDCRSTGQSIQDVFNTRSFQDQSMISYDEEKLLHLINYHLNYVHEAVEKLQSLFPLKK
ncbi:hypothetical protein BYT27DRAFT_7157576 [Phlegmacium glaucopus]|nr:hypothetical protein BYT27DRAFT_7157576 [Phlegmacium glaucopus]